MTNSSETSPETFHDMSELYRRYPALKEAERAADPRLERRRHILYHLPRHARGAEIGVFTGQFSEFMVQMTHPSAFYAVDPWHVAFGDHFPNWGAYSANGSLETAAAQAAVHARLKRFQNVNIVAARALDWIGGLDAESLDWAYVDSTHQYEPTLAELNALATKLAPNGVLAGDDCWPNREHHHFGVYCAVRDFVRANDFEIIELARGQWAARKSI